MRRILRMLAIVTIFFTATIGTLWACGYGNRAIFMVLYGQADEQKLAIEELRAQGPRGMEELLARRDRLRATLERPQPQAEKIQSQIDALNAVIDEVGGAKYCSVSGLYWYTDFDKAQVEAERTNRPILCLRMMGKLNEEFSCANSRFFRSTLYANETIAKELREKFVLHWGSVRPVPKVTIDFGDGRKLERTLTGNSIHYVVAADGRPLDGLPGLYGPQAFARWLERAEKLAASYAAADEGARSDLLATYHRERLAAIDQAWLNDIAQASPQPLAARGLPASLPNGQIKAAPTAEAATVRAVPKARIEMPILRQTNLASLSPPATFEQIDDATWQRIAALHAEDAQLDRASFEVIAAENPTAAQAGALSITKRVQESPVMRLVRALQTTIALDTVRNEYVLHRKLHQWFVEQSAPADLFALNERVYAELFLTPRSDPWLGLVSQDTYTALQNNGVVEPAGE